MSDLQTVPVGRADATVLLRDRRLVGLTALSRRVDLLTPLPRPQVRALPTTALLGDVPDGIYLWSRRAGAPTSAAAVGPEFPVPGRIARYLGHASSAGAGSLVPVADGELRHRGLSQLRGELKWRVVQFHPRAFHQVAQPDTRK